MDKEWGRITGATWGNPMSQMRKHYTGRAQDFGKPPAEQVDKSDTVHVWGFDERGSFNAVCGFLRSLGVRWYLPSYLPHVIGESINASKGISRGEDIWLSVRQDFDKAAIGFNHFQVYFTARMYWGGKEQGVDELSNEYCRLFYGPAGSEMKAFFEYCEANWQDMEKDKSKVDAAIALFAAAERKADAASVYGRRIALVADYLEASRAAFELINRGKRAEALTALAALADGDRLADRLQFQSQLPAGIRLTPWRVPLDRQSDGYDTFGTTNGLR